MINFVPYCSEKTEKGLIMSKVSSIDYPSYNSSSVSIGDSKATTGVANGVLTSNYKMSDGEAAIYNYALNTLASILPQLNTFDLNTQNSIQSEVDAYQANGVKRINEIYNPMITNLENNVASRFGNLDNSIFTDNLEGIESKRLDAVSSFAQDVLAKQSELKTNELTQRYALANLLSGITDSSYNKALSLINTALGSSNNANSYNSNLYNALSEIASTKSRSNLNNAGDILTTLLTLGGGSTSFLPL